MGIAPVRENESVSDVQGRLTVATQDLDSALHRLLFLVIIVIYASQ